MFNNVSWGVYLGAMVILAAVYYLLIGPRFFRDELKGILNGKLFKRKVEEENGPADDPGAYDTSSMDELEAVVNDLRYAVLEKTGKPADKGELLDQLKNRLAGYEGLNKPAFRVAINNYIIQYAKDICGVTYSEHELNSAWVSLSR